MIPPHEIRTLETRHLGQRVWHFPSVESTNTLALALAQKAGHDGLVLLADEQTSGRGQYGRTWLAPPGSSVLMSVLVFPPPALRRPALLTAWAADSVCEAIVAVTGLETRIKWPNDVMVQGKKVCGILIEQRNTGRGDEPLAAAVGIGLNVRQPRDFFIQADLPLGASLASLTGRDFETGGVAIGLIEHLDRAYGQMLAGELGFLEERWKRRLGVAGKEVSVEVANESRRGRVLDVSWEGVVLDDGVRLAPEAIRHLELIDC
jgi:BirA family biotin operon repressor/biotin-[acetyl-CoA-carboxylase] ligase